MLYQKNYTLKTKFIKCNMQANSTTDMFDLLHNHHMVDLDMCFFEYE